jgi:hypothetical protein
MQGVYKNIPIPSVEDLVRSQKDENILVYKKDGITIDLLKVDEKNTMSTAEANAKIERLMKDFINSCGTYRQSTLDLLL